jgi:Carboxypeptidase regulatory-like domain/TonB dependent receptor
MFKQVRFHAAAIWVILLTSAAIQAQQTLGGILGTVADKTGSVLPETTVTLVGDQTELTRTQKSNETGAYSFVNLPIGTYTLTFAHDGFKTQRIPSITVQADRSATLNVTLQIGQVGETVEVQSSPLMNAVDTTNGYILEQDQIQSAPLPTGSFTGLAILSPGVNAELPGGTGANSGLGNAPIWANGQRDTSNTFLMNGVDASNLFNGKSTSQVLSARVVLNTGTSTAASASAAPVQSTASPYLAIGQALPTPAPETVQELRVNTSMYDAQQGSTSGAHIDMSTQSGTNNLHGSLYGHRGTDWLNAAPFFFNQDPNIPADDKVPQLHRYTAGGTLGGPLVKDKLFGFVSYQHVHASDQEIGTSRPAVPFGLKNCMSGGPGCRDANDLAALANQNDLIPNGEPTITGSDVDPVALALLQYKLPNGQFLIPSDDGHVPTPNFPENSFVPGTALFVADQAVANLDWNQSSKDTVALKYYYQHDPSIAPFAYANVPGFPQHLDAGSQVASISNVQSLKPNLSIVEVLGILREKIYSTVGQPFSPSNIPSANGPLSINTFGDPRFPGITIADSLGNASPNNVGEVFNAALNFGGSAASQAAFTGVFQNRIMPSANATWLLGRHTVNFGGSYSYSQLNTRDDRVGYGMIGFFDFSQFLTGSPTSYTSDGFITTAYLQGNPNRYFRAGQSGLYLQDRYQFRPNLSVSAGLRFDWDGGLTEKYGRIYNFDPSRYSYDAATDTITSNGFIIAGNNQQFPTKGVSNSTLTGRQWGFAPRLGVAWSPSMFHDKVVVRAGSGMYYDRGELFSYLSPGFAAGVITAGPFGFNQTPPYVNSQLCNPTQAPYLGFIPTCAPKSFSNPWGTSLQPPPTGNPADITNFLPNAQGIINDAQLFSFATYNRANKLPYTINDTLDVQWQPRRDLAIEVGYVGNFGRHEVIPIPFNEPGIASPTHPIHCVAGNSNPACQQYTYGYTIVDQNFNSIALPNNAGNYLSTYEGGNVDLRVPYIGYSAESESYTAAGVSAYNALQTHVEKRMSHGLQVGFSYTYSHALDEQSALGLFYNGSNPQHLRDAYGSSDFDRTHVINFSYVYQLPNFYGKSTLKGRIADGWALQGITVIQSGQPYSVIDFSGAVGSIYFGTSDGITNPIVPLVPGCKAETGASGAFTTPALNASCFTLPLLAPGGLGGAIPSNDPYETNFISGYRNIFRQAWQKRADISIVKDTQLTERVSMKYRFDVFNVTNTASFDIPLDDVTQNENFNDFPTAGTPPSSFYNAPFGLGVTNKTIGSPRQVQMSLAFTF